MTRIAGASRACPRVWAGRGVEISGRGTQAYGGGNHRTGDEFNLITVLLAASLFVLGISGNFHVASVRLLTIGIGGALYLGSTIWLLTLPAA